MDKNRMRLGLMYIFAESSSLSKKGKIQLVNFIENASEHQLKALALDGEIHTSVELDEQTCDIIDGRFEDSGHVIKSLQKASILALESVTNRHLQESPIKYSGNKMLLMGQKYRRVIYKKEKAGCEKWNVKTPFKDQSYKNKMIACKAKAEIIAHKAEIKYLSQLAVHCKDDKCKRKVAEEIKDIHTVINDELKQYARLK